MLVNSLVACSRANAAVSGGGWSWTLIFGQTFLS